MGIIKCTTSQNTSYFEMYIEYAVTQDAEKATSTISHALKLKQLTDTSDFSGNMNVTYNIGNESFTYNANFDINDKGNAGSVFTIKSGNTTIQHDKSTGKGNFYVACSGLCNSGGYGPGNIKITGYYQSLPTISVQSNSIINSVNSLSLNSSNPVISMNLTVYSNYTHKLVIKDGSTSILTISDITCSIGTSNKTITLTSSEKQILLNYMSSKSSFLATYSLTTYKDGVKVGDVSTEKATIQISANSSAPIFKDFTHKDIFASSVALTGNNQIYIKGLSELQIVVGDATANNGATITSYRVTVGSKSKSFTTNPMNFKEITDISGNVTLTVEVVDSRGFSTAITKIIQVIDFERVSITAFSIRRRNEVEPTVQLKLSGNFSPVKIANAPKNKIKEAWFRYALTKSTVLSAEWHALQLSSMESDSGRFEINTAELSDENGVIDFDPNNQYVVEVRVEDEATMDKITLIVNKGMPLVSYRNKKVGINNPNPQGALDVRNGNILMNGYVVQGFVAELGDTEHLDDLKSSGVWTQAVSANASVDRGYPINEAGWLEVFENPQGGVMHRYTTCDCSRIFLRFYGEQWSEWKSTLFT